MPAAKAKHLKAALTQVYGVAKSETQSSPIDVSSKQMPKQHGLYQAYHRNPAAKISQTNPSYENKDYCKTAISSDNTKEVFNQPYRKQLDFKQADTGKTQIVPSSENSKTSLSLADNICCEQPKKRRRRRRPRRSKAKSSTTPILEPSPLSSEGEIQAISVPCRTSGDNQALQLSISNAANLQKCSSAEKANISHIDKLDSEQSKGMEVLLKNHKGENDFEDKSTIAAETVEIETAIVPLKKPRRRRRRRRPKRGNCNSEITAIPTDDVTKDVIKEIEQSTCNAAGEKSPKSPQRSGDLSAIENNSVEEISKSLVTSTESKENSLANVSSKVNVPVQQDQHSQRPKRKRRRKPFFRDKAKHELSNAIVDNVPGSDCDDNTSIASTNIKNSLQVELTVSAGKMGKFWESQPLQSSKSNGDYDDLCFQDEVEDNSIDQKAADQVNKEPDKLGAIAQTLGEAGSSKEKKGRQRRRRQRKKKSRSQETFERAVEDVVAAAGETVDESLMQLLSEQKPMDEMEWEAIKRFYAKDTAEKQCEFAESKFQEVRSKKHDKKKQSQQKSDSGGYVTTSGEDVESSLTSQRTRQKIDAHYNSDKGVSSFRATTASRTSISHFECQHVHLHPNEDSSTGTSFETACTDVNNYTKNHSNMESVACKNQKNIGGNGARNEIKHTTKKDSRLQTNLSTQSEREMNKKINLHSDTSQLAESSVVRSSPNVDGNTKKYEMEKGEHPEHRSPSLTVKSAPIHGKEGTYSSDQPLGNRLKLTYSKATSDMSVIDFLGHAHHGDSPLNDLRRSKPSSENIAPTAVSDKVSKNVEQFQLPSAVQSPTTVGYVVLDSKQELEKNAISVQLMGNNSAKETGDMISKQKNGKQNDKLLPSRSSSFTDNATSTKINKNLNSDQPKGDENNRSVSADKSREVKGCKAKAKPPLKQTSLHEKPIEAAKNLVPIEMEFPRAFGSRKNNKNFEEKDLCFSPRKTDFRASVEKHSKRRKGYGKGSNENAQCCTNDRQARDDWSSKTTFESKKNPSKSKDFRLSEKDVHCLEVNGIKISQPNDKKIEIFFEGDQKGNRHAHKHVLDEIVLALTNESKKLNISKKQRTELLRKMNPDCRREIMMLSLKDCFCYYFVPFLIILLLLSVVFGFAFSFAFSGVPFTTTTTTTTGPATITTPTLLPFEGRPLAPIRGIVHVIKHPGKLYSVSQKMTPFEMQISQKV